MTQNLIQAPSFVTTQEDDHPDFLGAFNGHVRRPQPTAKGVMAQFYGENGADADTILSLSMTKFQGQHVRVSVYWIKDAVGAPQRATQGYPKLVEFESFIHRSIPRAAGMVATLFAPNGPASDSAHELGFTKYLDSWVQVRLYKFIEEEQTPATSSAPAFLSQSIALPSHHAAPTTGKYSDAAKVLQLSGFFRNPMVWAALGGEEAYKSWLSDRACCAAVNPSCVSPGQATAIKGSAYDQFHFVALCSEHAPLMENRIDSIGGRHLLDQRRGMQMNEWSLQALCQRLSTVSLSSSHPRLVVEWAASNGVDALLPRQYVNHATQV
jgi:hypothetical protein